MLVFGPAEPIKQFNTISHHAKMLGMRKMNILLLQPCQVAESCRIRTAVPDYPVRHEEPPPNCAKRSVASLLYTLDADTTCARAIIQ